MGLSAGRSEWVLLLTELTVSCRFVIHDFSAREPCITQCLNPPLLQEPAEGTRQQKSALSVPSTLQLLPVTSPWPPVPAQEGFTELLDPGHRGCLRTVRAAGGRGDVPPPQPSAASPPSRQPQGRPCLLHHVGSHGSAEMLVKRPF